MTEVGMKEITPIDNNGSILLRFSYNGKRYSLNTGGKYTDKVALDNAKSIATKIYNDCENNCFDTTLVKYKENILKSRSAKQAIKDYKEAILIVEKKTKLTK